MWFEAFVRLGRIYSSFGGAFPAAGTSRQLKLFSICFAFGGPVNGATKPDYKAGDGARDLKRSRKIGESSGFGTDWSCGPHQLESIMAVREDASKGNLTKDSRLEEDLLENLILTPTSYRL